MTSPIQIVGILNVTPDSFSDGGNFFDPALAVARALEMVAEGADIIDIGGESSRPGSEGVSVEEELRRVIGVVAAIRRKSAVAISVDTTKALVAAQAVDAGASIINDISAGRFDPEMFSVVVRCQAPYCMMHMQGTPKTMQEAPHYGNVVEEVKNFLRERITAAEAAGIARKKIIIDPGIGFGKRVEDNVRLLKGLDQFQELGCPILIGASRKSFIGALTGAGVQNRLPGSLAAAAMAVQGGAQILRVHDVAATKQFLQVFRVLSQVSDTYRTYRT